MKRFRPKHLTFRLLLLIITVGMAFTFVSPPVTQAQELAEPVTLSVEAGFDSYFREGDWLPLRIAITNDGDDIIGRLVVRPETSGSNVTNTFSTPISLPNGSRKTAFLYVMARAFAQHIRVELIDDNNLVYADRDVTLHNIQDSTPLYLVVTDSPTGTVDLSNVTFDTAPAYQASWRIDNIPERAAALDSVDVMVFNNVDTGALTPNQARVVADWVTAGGHLIVTGGANWEPTSIGLRDLLPLIPDDTSTISTLDELELLANSSRRLNGQAVVATGELKPQAQILATAEEIPLVVRQSYGGGMVDYLTADPLSQPLRGWSGLKGLWFSLLDSVNPAVSWSQGVQDMDYAINAIEILPGVNLLPQVLALCGFLMLYITLIGPLNYLILNRLNRREWAWATIPVLIVVFSVIAWIFGFNLRGNIITLSHLSVVQSWPDADRARVDQMVGLLSPQRATYDLAVTDDRLLHPINRPLSTGLFGGGSSQTNIDIRQTDTLKADQFPVDASFIATFASQGMMEKPAISGKVTLSYTADGLTEQMQGVVRNDTDLTLSNPVILAGNMAVYLDKPLEPGALVTFDDTLIRTSTGVPHPAALEPNSEVGSSVYVIRYSHRFNNEITLREIFNNEYYRADEQIETYQGSVEEQEDLRRFFLLESLLVDRFDTTGRGNRAYLIGWSDIAPLPFEVTGSDWVGKDTTLYIVELEHELAAPDHTIRLTADKFTWVTQKREGISGYTGPFDIRLNTGEMLIYRFTPLPDSVLTEVDELTVYAGKGGRVLSPSARVAVWNWQRQRWDTVQVDEGQVVLRSPEAYIGPQNAVEVRLSTEDVVNYVDFGDIKIEQRGQF